ncbi:PhzF family phenazine biosynthesis protein [Streptomyces sp. NPDC046275]|uniref:PhzF family phenazine biosynthesis protein n=1 Tax=Streptomyces sp. NPDC046275 TaxID=3157201 RepID=UPI0033DB3495
MRPDVTVVRACLRDGDGDGGGGSPTAVVCEDAGEAAEAGEAARQRVPEAYGTSHAVFVRRAGDTVGLRFFTSGGELPACGHGTVAALAVLAARGGPGPVALSAGGRRFTGRTAPVPGAPGRVAAAFDPGPVALRAPRPGEQGPLLAALGLRADAEVRIAGVGRERALVAVPDRAALWGLAPDPVRLRAACDRAGLLGAYVYTAPGPEGALAARMFAPSIGVPEDIANANSTACLAALLGRRGIASIAVDMGDALGSPATVTAAVRPDGSVEVGGLAEVPPG